MGVVTDYFDRTYCVNLDERKDKWEESLREFTKHGLNVTRLPAVVGKDVPYDGDLKRGVIGCALSHRNIIFLAKHLGLKTVLIFEDDVAFEEGLNKKFEDWTFEVPENWDMLYFGGNHNVRELTKLTEHTFKATKTQTTHAYAVRDTVYELILNRLENLNLDVDVIYTELQKQCNAYCFTPRLAWQRPCVSDIWDQYVDYDFLRNNDGCHPKMK